MGRMEHTDTTGTAAMRRVPTSDLRPGIVTAHVVASGVWDDRTQGRGAEISTLVLFDDGTTERRVYDFLPGWDSTQGYGGWKAADPLVQKAMDHAVEWLAAEYPAAPYVEV